MIGGIQAIEYAESWQYTEPLFVFVIMVVAASRPVVEVIKALVALMPLIGSLITEPAAMTPAALMLASLVVRAGISEWLKYAALGVLFVKLSVGGILTSFAAPPVLMVAATWNWDSAFMVTHFGWKAVIAVIINATVITYFLRTHLSDARPVSLDANQQRIPLIVSAIHRAFLATVVAFAHHPVIFLGLFLLFLGFTQA